MNRKTIGLCLVAIVISVNARLHAAGELVITSDKPAAIYDIGQPIHWKVKWQPTTQPTSINFVVKKNDLTKIDEGKLILTDGVGEVQARLNEPGWMLLKVTAKTAEGRTIIASGGALANPEKIQPASPRPDDFDEFWNARLEELAAVPPDPNLESVPTTKPNVDYWKITMNNIRGTHIEGQIARPSKGEKFPALLILQWAGVYPLDKSWVVDKAADGWLALDINAHDLPIDQPRDFYRQQATGPLKDYDAIGNDDRNTSYFLRMYLSAYRGAEYLTHRDDWNGKTFVVMGTSQGGMQTLMLAGLHPNKITAVTADVPAGSDMLGPDAGRMPGWPDWYWRTTGKDPDKVHEASRYFDVINFASHIKCPVLVGMGALDETSTPTSVFAALNQIQSPKEILLMPHAPHQEANKTHQVYYDRSAAWRAALVKDEPPPIDQK
ncbi:MAG TPA: alpha/beta fold hydrolase [Tepidisphaeraceae bacterium]|nr:alpha/beta fold hydrolase [Tepidisphaeraceae bacterium]